MLLNATIFEMISLSMLGNMESPMNSMSAHESWSTKTWAAAQEQENEGNNPSVRGNRENISARGWRGEPPLLLLASNGTRTYLREPVQEGLGQPFAAPSLRERVLAGKDLGLLVLDLEAHGQFGDVNLGPVIKAGVQALQHRLRRQVQLAEIKGTVTKLVVAIGSCGAAFTSSRTTQ